MKEELPHAITSHPLLHQLVLIFTLTFVENVKHKEKSLRCYWARYIKIKSKIELLGIYTTA
jgi:hypothetical protein